MRAMRTGCWALSLLLTVPPTEASAARSDYSWGKPGISRSQYDADAIGCSRQAASRDVEADRETQEYVRGFEVLERENNMPPMARPSGDESQANRNVLLRRIYGPDRKVKALQAKLQGEVETCLIARGFTRFQLSRDQSRQLTKFRIGSPERREFLYRLGSDADIVSSQRPDKPGR